VLVAGEADVAFLQPAEALHIDLIAGIDQDVGNGRVGQQRFQGAQAEHLVLDVLDHLLALGRVEGHVLLGQETLHQDSHLIAQFRRRQVGHHLQVDPFEELPVDHDLGLLEAAVVGSLLLNAYRVGQY